MFTIISSCGPKPFKVLSSKHKLWLNYDMLESLALSNALKRKMEKKIWVQQFVDHQRGLIEKRIFVQRIELKRFIVTFLYSKNTRLKV